MKVINYDAAKAIIEAIDQLALDYDTLSILHGAIEIRTKRAKIERDGRSKVTLWHLLDMLIQRRYRRTTGKQIESMREAIKRLNAYLGRTATLNDLREPMLARFAITYQAKRHLPSLQKLQGFAAKMKLIERVTTCEEVS